METPKINKNLFNWTGFHKTEEEAEKSLKEKTKKISEMENKLILSSKKELLPKKCHDMLIYKFTVKTIDNNEK
jgi:hypothetical protein